MTPDPPLATGQLAPHNVPQSVHISAILRGVASRRKSTLMVSLVLLLGGLGAAIFVPHAAIHAPLLVTTGVALLLAAFQHDEARRMKGSLKELVTSIAEQSKRQADIANGNLMYIRESMSTQYVGEHPIHMPEIAKLLGKATTSVEILCDVPGYGHYSARERYADYRAALERLANSNVKIAMAFYTKTLARRAAISAYGRSFDDISKAPEFIKHTANMEQPVTSAEDFYDLIVDKGYVRCYNHFDELPSSSVAIIPVYKPVQIYFWIIDGRQAVFSIASLGLKPSEFAFTTSDAKLIIVFQRLFDEVKQRAELITRFRRVLDEVKQRKLAASLGGQGAGGRHGAGR